MPRSLTLKLMPIDGTIERFYAFVDCKKRISHDGDQERSWTGKIDDADTRIKLRVFGVGNAKYRVSIDLPGTIDDQELVLRLDGGYGELELRI